MNTTAVRERFTAPPSLRSAWLMSRACRPGSESPMSPSISALGTRAATESITTTSTAPERTRISVISSPCSPVSGWETSRLSMSTPSFLAYSTSSACSASMYARAPPCRCAFATTCSASVVLPLDSGPKISVTRPRGMPPMPIAASRLIAPVGTTSTRTRGASAPMRMIEPLPQVFSICVMARFSALRRSSESFGTAGGVSRFSAIRILDMVAGLLVRPEYIPKPDLPPAGTKRVFQVLQLIVLQPDAVEAVDVPGLPMPVDPAPGDLHHLTPLLTRHRLERRPEPLPAPHLHFEEHDQSAAAGDEVDFGAPHPEAVRHDVPPLRLQVGDRLLLTGEAIVVPLVRPRRGVAAQTASHACELTARRRSVVTNRAHDPPFFMRHRDVRHQTSAEV